MRMDGSSASRGGRGRERKRNRCGASRVRRGKRREMIRSFLQMRRSHDNDYIYKSLRLLIARLYIETGVYSPFRVVVNVAPNAHCGLIQPHTRRDEARTCINGSICGRSYRRARRIWLHGYDVGHRPPPRPSSFVTLFLFYPRLRYLNRNLTHTLLLLALFFIRIRPPAYTLLLSP